MTAVPESVLIAGPKDVLKKLTEIPMSLDITGQNQSIEKNLLYDEVLRQIDESLQLVRSNDKENGLAVTVTIEKKEDKAVSVALDKVDLTNKQEGYTYEISEDSGEIIADVTAAASVLESFTADDVTASADMSGLAEGEHTVFVTFKSGKSVTFIRPQVAVNIIVARK